MKLFNIKSLFYGCIAILIALIDKLPLQLDQRIGTHYVENGFYVTYNGILHNTMEAPYPYRFLVVKIVDFLSCLWSISPIKVAVILNVIFIFLVLHTFTKYAEKFILPFNAFMATLILAFFILIIQAQFIGVIIIETQDILNALFFILLLILGNNQKWLYFGIVLAISITNRETTLILLLPFSYLLLSERKIKPLLWINSVGILVYFAIRFLISVKKSDYPNFANLRTNFPGLQSDYFFRALEHNLHLWVMILPVLFFAFMDFRNQEMKTKALILTAIPFLLIHYLMGSIMELRLFLPLIILLLPITLKNLKPTFENK